MKSWVSAKKSLAKYSLWHLLSCYILQINVFSDKYKGHCAYVNVQQDRQNKELGCNMPFIGEWEEKYDEIVK